MRSQGEGKRMVVIGGPCLTCEARTQPIWANLPTVSFGGGDCGSGPEGGRRWRTSRWWATPKALAGPEKAATGITGFDEITGGGLPRGRPTLVAGAAGSGKTLFGVEFLVRGAREYGEPGVLLAFEESQSDLATNVASLGFDLDQLEKDGLLAVDAFRLDPNEIIETGSFDLEGLFIRLAMAVEAVGAKRVFLDTIELLFSALPNEAIIRGELGRLFRWLKERELTVVISGERGRAGRPDPVRHRGVRLGLRGHPGPSGRGPDLHPTPARGEVPRLPARHQRVPVPDHRDVAWSSYRSPRSA